MDCRFPCSYRPTAARRRLQRQLKGTKKANDDTLLTSLHTRRPPPQPRRGRFKIALLLLPHISASFHNLHHLLQPSLHTSPTPCLPPNSPDGEPSTSEPPRDRASRDLEPSLILSCIIVGIASRTAASRSSTTRPRDGTRLMSTVRCCRKDSLSPRSQMLTCSSLLQSRL
jgi:hypothetical protein